MTVNEETCISKIKSINHKHYLTGLFGQEGLIIDGSSIACIIKSGNSRIKYIYNLETKEIEGIEHYGTQSKGLFNDLSEIQPNSITNNSNDMMHYEGPCTNNCSFGYVSLFNCTNELLYQGVIINDKKECFGIDYYPDLGIVEYCGCYWNNQRHGFGMLYDHRGNLEYEGDFMFDSNVYETSIELDTMDSNDRTVHSLIHELVIGKECGNDFMDDLDLSEFDCLERVVVKKKSFQNLKSLTIANNPVLAVIEIEDGSLMYSDDGVFQNVDSLIVESMMID